MAILDFDHAAVTHQGSEKHAMSEESTAAVVEEEPAVAVPEADKKTKPKRQPRYNVILWNDEEHTHEYVILLLADLFAHPVETGYKLACEVDKTGRAIVFTTTMEHAELKRDQVHAYGKDRLVANCAGSMRCTIEPAPGDGD